MVFGYRSAASNAKRSAPRHHLRLDVKELGWMPHVDVPDPPPHTQSVCGVEIQGSIPGKHPMQILPYLVGGLTAFLVMDVNPIPSPSQQLAALRASATTPQLGTRASSVNRAAKADRGVTPAPATAAARIAPVEVVGVRDAAIVYRDRDGRELFRTDPVNNVTIVAKGLPLPQLTVRQHSNSAVKPVPINEIQEQARDEKPRAPRGPKVPVGCEPSFSPVAAPNLAHHIGRCVAHLEMPWTVAG